MTAIAQVELTGPEQYNKVQMSEWMTDVNEGAGLADIPIRACGRQGLPSA